MNPAYGRAVERAREGVTDTSADGDGHWVTISGHHVLIRETQSRQSAKSRRKEQQVYEEPDINDEKEVELTNVTYNETSSLRANPNTKPRDADSAEQLHAARVAVAEIAKRVLDSAHPRRVQAGTDLSSRTVQDLNDGNEDIIAGHNDSLLATREALGGSNTTHGAMHYMTSSHRSGHFTGTGSQCNSDHFPMSGAARPTLL
jgi:hypothetical protein